MNTDRFQFRAWDSESGSMANWEDLDTMDGEGIVHLVDLLNGKEPGMIAMQSTGLKDRNGVLIFEGDIVLDKGLACQVLWLDEGAQFITQEMDGSGNWDIMSDPSCGGYYEVIGNIHENPELLNQDQ